MLKNLATIFFIFLVCGAYAIGPDADKCQEVHLADIGWTDVTVTTAAASIMLERLGYVPKVALLSLPITLKSLSNNDIDVFLGNWMPSQTNDIKSYVDKKEIEDLGVNLSGAKFTLAVTKNAFDAGVKNFSDLASRALEFEYKIYGIEPGNEGNRNILQIINHNDFSLGKWQLVESSEPGLLMQVEESLKQNKWIVFLAWSPHPMNLKYAIHYLAGGDDYFGKNFGEATVHTLVRKNFKADCPNLGIFFSQLKFNLAFEETVMIDIMEGKLSPMQAAQKAMEKYPQLVKKWISNVQPFSQKLASSPLAKPTSFKLSLGDFAQSITHKITTRFSPMFRSFSNAIEAGLDKAFDVILSWPSWLCILLLSLMAFLLKRSLLYALCTLGTFSFIYYLGYFDATIKTLVMTIMATIICVIFGVPLGIICARSKVINNLMVPVLNMMQTIPTFVYLLPTLMLFGLGMVPGLISTIIFAIAAPIKFTTIALKGVPLSQKEAAASLGGTPLQILWQVEIPLGMPTMIAGISQCIMLSLSMVVLAALVGAEGLGEPVVRALNTVNIGMGFEAGLVILLLAVILDRLLCDINDSKIPTNLQKK